MQPAANPITEQILRLNSTCVDYIDTRSCRQKEEVITINA